MTDNTATQEDTERAAEATKAAMRKVPLAELDVNYNTLQSLIHTPTIPQRYKESPSGVQDMYAATLAGRELGVGWWTSIHEIFIVNGQSSMQGKLMLALVWRAGHQVKIDIGETSSTVHCYRRFEGDLDHVGDVTFTVEDAATAGLLDKGTYESYPKIMLTWRAVSMACRLYFSDCILSLGHVPEEMGIDAPMQQVPGYHFDDETGLMEQDRDYALEEGIEELVDVIEAEIVEES